MQNTGSSSVQSNGAAKSQRRGEHVRGSASWLAERLYRACNGYFVADDGNLYVKIPIELAILVYSHLDGMDVALPAQPRDPQVAGEGSREDPK